MKKRLLIILVILIVGAISYIMVDKVINTNVITGDSNNTIDYSKMIVTSYSHIDEASILLKDTSSFSFAYDLSDNEVIANKADFIIIGTITDIEGGINYNPVAKCYTVIETIGQMKVDMVLKGDIKDKEIGFIKSGGMITLAEYEKSLRKEELEEFNENKYTQEEKDNKYVSEYLVGDIPVEKDKTYLMYLRYSKDFNRYGIVFFEYGFREIDTNTLKSDFKSIMIKDNKTGEFEALDNVVAESVVKNIKE